MDSSSPDPLQKLLPDASLPQLLTWQPTPGELFAEPLVAKDGTQRWEEKGET